MDMMGISIVLSERIVAVKLFSSLGVKSQLFYILKQQHGMLTVAGLKPPPLQHTMPQRQQ